MVTAEDVKDILDGRREFSLEVPGQGLVTAYIAAPSGEDLRKADWQYAKVFNQAIVDGFLTQAQMLDTLKEKRIVDDAYAQQVESVRVRLATQLYKLETLDALASEIEQEALAVDIAKLRDELFRLNQKVNGPMGNTCENIAEDTRIECLTSRIVQKKDRTPYWKDYDAYKTDSNVSLTVKARFEVMLWLQGLESNFLETTPEQIALRKLAQRRLDRALEDIKPANSSAEAPVTSEEVLSLETVKVKRAGRPKKEKAGVK